MPVPLRRTSLLLLVSSLCAAPLARAQAVPPSPASSPSGDTLVLSPFEVSTSKDVGFVANSSLAGGRLAGELKDTPAAYSVLTREFIDALNLTDLHEASQWTVNSDYAPTDGSGDIFASYNETNSRGVSASAPLRNFFPQIVNPDSYNLERFDFSRGPNSILFGAGSFGGAANVVTKVPVVGRRFDTVQLGYGSWENERVTADLNEPLGKNVALRFNAVWGDRGGWRDFEMERKKAATLSGLWKITRNTEVRLEAERGEDQRNLPATYLRDQFTGWDGKTTFSGPVTSLPSNASALGVARIGGPYFIYSPGLNTTTISDFGNTAKTLGGRFSVGVPVDGQQVVGPTPNFSGQPYNDALNVPPNWGSVGIANSHFTYPSRSFAQSTNTPTTKQIFNNYTLTLRHQIGSHLFFELAGNYSNTTDENQYFNVRGLGVITIDINKLLPDGTPNPHFLDAYSDGTRSRRLATNQYRDARFAIAYDTGETRFGAFTFNTYGGIDKRRFDSDIQTLRVLRNPDPRKWPFNDAVSYRYYFNEHDRPMPDVYTATYNGVTYPAAWIGDSARATDVSQSNNELKYIQGAVRAKLFSNRLNVLAAVRRDMVDNGRWLNANYGDYPANWDGRQIVFLPAAPADYQTLMYTPKDATGKAIGAPVRADVRPRDGSRNPLPQYANDRFQDDYSPPHTRVNSNTYSLGSVYHVNKVVSVFGNYATSFNPPGTSLRYDGSFNPAQESKGVDVGIRLGLLHDRVNVSLGTYWSSETNQQIQSTITNAINAFSNANIIGDLTPGDRNIRGLVDVPTQVFDTRDRKNHGYELEIVANLTPSWRLLFNAAIPEAYQYNAWKDSRAYLASHDTVLRQIAKDTGVTIGANNVAEVDQSVPTNQQSPDAGAVASAWNTLQNFQQSLVTGQQKIVGVTKGTANLFTDYQFRTGKLRGLSIGGGVNYRGKKIIGYRGADTIVDPANPANAIDDPSVDAYTVLYTKAYALVTATIGYNYRINAKRSILFQFRVANLLNESYPLYYSDVLRPPGGNINTPARVDTPDSFAYQTPRSYMFTTTFKF